MYSPSPALSFPLALPLKFAKQFPTQLPFSIPFAGKVNEYISQAIIRMLPLVYVSEKVFVRRKPTIAFISIAISVPENISTAVPFTVTIAISTACEDKKSMINTLPVCKALHQSMNQ